VAAYRQPELITRKPYDVLPHWESRRSSLRERLNDLVAAAELSWKIRDNDQIAMRATARMVWAACKKIWHLLAGKPKIG
jgi:hypothetical protein